LRPRKNLTSCPGLVDHYSYDLGKVGLKVVDLRLNANNLTNESYIASCASLSYCYMGEERNVSATVSYQF
ncbi:hypothetical protein WLF18_24945, partial [Pseudomonas shirazensis]